MPDNAAQLSARTGAPAMRPIYRIDRSFEWNGANGPDFAGPWPEVPATPMTEFFGLPARSRFGLAASVLVSARWVETYARLGFDILTYKTVRRVARRCLEAPNWKFLDPAGLAGLADESASQRVAPGLPEAPHLVTGVGSFGMPSSAPEFWSEDIAASKRSLALGQVLLVSVVATVEPDTTERRMIREFGELAARVRAAGADAVEANLSCPNVARREGEVYRHPELAGSIAAAVKAEAGGAPVTIKIGHIADEALLERLLCALNGHADGVTLINGVSREIRDASGAPAFGPDRLRAGVIGGCIRDLALANVRSAAAIIRRHGLGLRLIGVGGASSPADIQAFRDAGAYAVQSASGAIWNPLLAVEAKRALGTL